MNVVWYMRRQPIQIIRIDRVPTIRILSRREDSNVSNRNQKDLPDMAFSVQDAASWISWNSLQRNHFADAGARIPDEWLTVAASRLCVVTMPSLNDEKLKIAASDLDSTRTVLARFTVRNGFYSFDGLDLRRLQTDACADRDMLWDLFTAPAPERKLNLFFNDDHRGAFNRKFQFEDWKVWVQTWTSNLKFELSTQNGKLPMAI